MNIRRYFGKNSREALAIVRKELGDDAVILSNRAVSDGNEIMAFSAEEMNTVVNNTPLIRAHDGEPNTQRAESAPWLSLLKQNSDEPNHPLEATNAKAESKASNTMPSKQMLWVLKEMRSMRNVIESQLATIAWSNIQQREPIKAEVLGTLLGASFSPALSRYLAEKLPANLDSDKAQAWVKYILSKNLNTVENEAEILDQGGVFALIGPTGVGKTTTTAKLAARYVMKHGTQNLGLITTDAYRVGGHEQLRIYGKILGVIVHAVKDEADLALALNELKHKHTILIDTVGVSQRDRMVTEQIALLSAGNTPIKKLLCLSATNTGETLTDVISAYKGKGLDGCIITKLDEAATIGNTLDVIIREKLKLYYTATGQRVPEDINLADKKTLIALALNSKSPANRPFEFLVNELPFIMGQANNTTNISLAEI
ncbi:flagellar biosynthesis protein FlhF [Methylotenera mobilis]|uniref:Flagellar biosynthesis protein FlhF n=1 Tax=Methylotenera mobilis (strain JLW8 / ATCC BAA-1282 / DSM 17540) TaxID=583345 RepID=C6WW76_METML|nr:flagellar biosynthesis protein FlhF [Methylotenera mobilis]ACT48175.1 GTP-binding signal recognition particle SRP54 G- domain protein [Methylotenera mobilis JLW8]